MALIKSRMWLPTGQPDSQRGLGQDKQSEAIFSMSMFSFMVFIPP
jgi:hypothetical protein